MSIIVDKISHVYEAGTGFERKALDNVSFAIEDGEFIGLIGHTSIGDLIVTCESRQSRNRKAGMLIGQGYTMKQATDEVKMVVEGIYSAKAALALAKKYDVELPIIEEVNKVLFDDKPAKEGVKDLMVREKRVEHLNLKWEN